MKPRHQQPFWSDPATIHHKLDHDIVDSMRRGNEKCSSLMMMDPSYDSQQSLYHIKWTGDDVEALLEGMVARSLESLRYADSSKDLFQEELRWIHSSHFSEVAAMLGMDAAEIRNGTVSAMRHYNKSNNVSLSAEFAMWREVFAEEFKIKVGVKVNTYDPNGFKTLKSMVKDDYELSALLNIIGEYLDDLTLAGHARKPLVKQLLLSINSK